MTSYPDPSSSSTFDEFKGQDGAWYGSAGMLRTDSQSTSCTVDSSYTTSTVVSGYSSATDFSSVEHALPEDDAYCERSAYPDPCSIYEPPYEPVDANHILSATGSQYFQNGHQLPQALQLSSPLPALGTLAGNEHAARQATFVAASLIINGQPFGNSNSSLITSEAIEEALKARRDQGMEEPVRPAVQDVLYRQLQPLFGDIDHYYADIIRLLEEAAYQLQIRLQGPEVLEICSVAIAVVLAMLTGNTEADNSGVSSGWVEAHGSPAQTLPEKEKYRCPYPGCKNGASRQADLDRHFNVVHLEDDKKIKHICDYKKCPRHTAPFYRQDHFRDHLRIYHKEDLLRRGNKGDEEWWSSRAPRALYNGWWRCSRCLIRVRLDTDAFTCPNCQSCCEKERQQYRMASAGAELRADYG